ncbi:MAG: DUF86 domain-containing protein [Candidatus Hydrogenedentes bacterium]|nr:DUF86 domain-containing protein [Candidatus Hydrogenedentota bacterium]
MDNIARIEVFIRGMTYATFCADDKTAFVVVTCFSIIGEAARLIPEDIKSAHPNVPWNQMIRMRNVLVHEYDKIDLEIVWSTATKDLPVVLPKLKAVLEASVERREEDAASDLNVDQPPQGTTT